MQSREVLRMLRYRQKLIKLRTMTKNSLQAIALQAGLAKGQAVVHRRRTGAVPGRGDVSSVAMATRALVRTAKAIQRTTIGNNGLVQGAKQRRCRIQRLRTHPGIGLLTSLCLLHTLQPVSRFRNARKVTAYAGFDPVERSSAERQHLSGDQQGRVADAALPVGGSSAHRSQI